MSFLESAAKLDSAPDAASLVPRGEEEPFPRALGYCPSQYNPLCSWLVTAGAHCWFLFALLPTRTSRCFSEELLPCQSVPSLCWQWIFFCLRCKTSHLYFSFSWVFLQLVCPPCWAVLLSTVSAIQPSMVLSLNLLRELSIPSSRALRYWTVSVSVLPVCWGTSFIKGCHLRLHSVGCCLLRSMI